MKLLTCVISMLVLIGSFSTAHSAGKNNKLTTYKKNDGTYITFSDGSGKVNLGCKEKFCRYITGKFTHPHNIQQHKKTFIKLNADGSGSYTLWSYKGDEKFCSGKITKWGLLYKGKELVSPNYIFLASKKHSKHPECNFKNETIMYTDLKANDKGAQFQYFLNER